jgi:hypothetical protein
MANTTNASMGEQTMSYGTVQAEKMTTESGYSLGAGNASSFKNRIINGDMSIDQRNNGSAVTSASGYIADRWSVATFAPNGGAYTAQQITDAPVGFRNSLRVTTTATPSSNADQFFQMFQPIEGFNVADFLLGTANAITFTLSFWVKSSLTGTFCAAFTNNQSTTRSYISTYTINSANTWEYKTITVQGDTSGVGTWGTTNGQGLSVFFDLGSGTNQEASAVNTWQTGNFRRVSGAVRVVGTNGATFQVTGVQLEVGTVATSFDFVLYGTELALCQRYLPAFNSSGTVPLGVGYAFTTSNAICSINFPVQTRVAPSGISTSPAGDFQIVASAAFTASAIAYNSASTTVGYIQITASGLTTNGGLGARFASPTGQLLFTGCEL